jgi:spore coat protein CotH
MTKRGPIAALAVVVLCAQPAALQGQTPEDVFAVNEIHDIRLFVNSRDLQRLRARFDQNTVYPADMQWRSLRVKNVGIRSRGAASRNPVKLGLEIDFSRYNNRQRFLGLRSLVLDNLWQDPAMIRERVVMGLFERMGEPAPRESFCRLYINNEYQGLYSIVEAVDESFLGRVFGEYTGYLFEYHRVREFHGEYLGEALGDYRPFFEPRNHRMEAEWLLYAPIRDLFREINQPVDDVWRGRVEQYLDLEQFIRTAAIDAFLAEGDGVLGFSGMNNFYLYRHVTTNQHSLIVWDRDQSFREIESPIVPFDSANELFTRALAFADLRALYLDTLERCAGVAADGDWLLGEIDRFASLAAQAAYEDTRKPFPSEDFDNSVEYLRAFAAARPGFVQRAVEQARRVGLQPRAFADEQP